MKNTLRRLLPLVMAMSLAVCLFCVNALAVDTGADDALPIEILEPDLPTTNDEVIEIQDEEVPLADLPANAAQQVTGDALYLWLAIGGFSSAALVTVVVAGRKQKEN